MENTAAAPVAWRADTLKGLLATFDRALEGACVGLLLIMTAITVVQVFFRYVLNNSISWSEELARWIFVWMIFLGMAVAVRRSSHVQIDMFLNLLPRRPRAGLQLLLHALTVTTCAALLFHGWDLAGRVTMYSPALGWDAKYLFMSVPVGAAIALYYLARQSLSLGPSRAAGPVGFVVGLGVYWLLREQGNVLLSSWSPSALLNASVLVLLLLGFPVGFALVLSSYLAIWPKGPLVVLAVTQNMVGMADSFILLSVPFFILAGGLMNAGGITRVLVRLADTLVGHIRGGMGQANVVTNTFMAGMSGSSSADAAGIAKVLVPAMKTQGYDPVFAAAVTSASSVLANIIPPSISMLLYAALASVSVGAIYLGGVIPGLIMAACLMVIVYVQSRRFGYGASRKRASLREILSALRSAFWALGMPLIILGGIGLGVFTATEAASVAVVYALITGFLVYRGLTWRSTLSNASQSVLETITVVFIMAASAPFAWLLVMEQVPQAIAAQLGALTSNPALLMLLLNVFLLIVGLPLEPAPALAILVPILLPIVTHVGINPVYFGVVMIINLMIGSLTPPVGVLVFVVSAVSKVPVHKVFWSVVPFEAALIVALLIVTYVPMTVLWLPHLVSGR